MQNYFIHVISPSCFQIWNHMGKCQGWGGEGRNQAVQPEEQLEKLLPSQKLLSVTSAYTSQQLILMSNLVL